MTDRAAIDTIRGYFYQFDFSILSIMNLVDEDATIVIEGVEDVDIETATDETAVQCKYYAKTEYNHSVIAEPIRLMLDHFKEVKTGSKKRIKYKLRGHYKSGHGKLSLPITLQFLKDQFLTFSRTEKIAGVDTKEKHYYHTELGLDDPALADFLTLLEVDINAKEFEAQYEEIIDGLTKIFTCSRFTAEYYHYNSSLGVVRELAKEASYDDRKISKRSFLKKIDESKIIFNEWFIKLKGKKARFEELKKEYFTALNVSPFERFFLIQVDQHNYLRNELKELLLVISKKWSKLSKREPAPFCPYFYIHDLPPAELVDLKQEMVNEGFMLIDGYDYSGAHFNAKSISRRADFNNGIKIKIINTIKDLEETINLIRATRHTYQFYLKSKYFNNTNPAVKDVSIQIEKLADIKNII